MPEHVLMSEIEIITDGGRRRRWTAAEKLRIVEETLEDHASISIVARRNGVAPNLARIVGEGSCSKGGVSP
jgi:transposase